MNKTKIKIRLIGVMRLLIFLVCFGAIVWFASSREEEANRPIIQREVKFSASQEMIKAMTFNIRTDLAFDGPNRWNKRRDIVFDTLADNAADVVGFQEMRPLPLQQVAQALPQYNHYAVGRWGGKDEKQIGESCAIFYRKDRFKLADCGTFWFSEEPCQPGTRYMKKAFPFPESMFPRICSWVYLIEENKGSGFYVYNMHLDDQSQFSREKSVELLLKQIASRKTKEPFIILGDFNMGLDNPAMKYLQNVNCQTQYPKMTDAWGSLNPDPNVGRTYHAFQGISSGPGVDHILVESGSVFEVNGASIDRRNVNGSYPSDHFPVTAKLFFKKS